MKKLIVLSLLLLLLFNVGNSQKARSTHEIHAMMVYNFMKYIDFPYSERSEFVIGIIGDEDTYKTMSDWYNGKGFTGGRTIRIIKYDHVSDINEINDVTFLTKNNSSEHKQIFDKLKDTSTLLISARNGLGRKGSVINFVIIGNKLTFEINEEQAKLHNLKISSTLLHLGKKI